MAVRACCLPLMAPWWLSLLREWLLPEVRRQERLSTTLVPESLTVASKALLLSLSGPLAKNQCKRTTSPGSAAVSLPPQNKVPGLPVKPFKALGLPLLISPGPWLHEANLCSCSAVTHCYLWALFQGGRRGGVTAWPRVTQHGWGSWLWRYWLLSQVICACSLI